MRSRINYPYLATKFVIFFLFYSKFHITRCTLKNARDNHFGQEICGNSHDRQMLKVILRSFGAFPIFEKLVYMYVEND